jgi:hypothetical protein
VIGAADAATAVDEGVEHQGQELIGELEADSLRAGGGFAGELAQRIGEIAAGEAEDGHEGGRQRAAIIEKGVEGVGDIELIDTQAASAERARTAGLPERGGEVQDRVGRGVA